MTRFYRRNLTIKLVSVLLAFLLWVYVGNQQNPTRDRFVPNVPLEYRGLPGDLAVLSIPAGVSVRVQGSGAAMNNFSPKDIKAYVNLDEASPGVNWLDVKVVVPPGLRVATVQPDRVKVETAAMGQKQIPIHVDYQGETAPGYGAGKPVLKPEVVVVRGPADRLDRVDRAFVTVELRGAKTDLVEYLPVQVVDHKGGVLDSRVFRYEPKVIDVRVPVVKNLPTKEVPVKPALRGEPVAGFRVDRVVVVPARVTVQGDERLVQQLAEVITAPIDLTGKGGDFTVEVDLQQPPGITSLTRKKVRVEVRIKQVEDNLPNQVYDQQLPQG